MEPIQMFWRWVEGVWGGGVDRNTIFYAKHPLLFGIGVKGCEILAQYSLSYFSNNHFFKVIEVFGDSA